MVCQFEDLPNELLLDLFEYIDARDLYHGFWLLNQRINELIQSLTNLSLTCERNESPLIALFANRITRLVVKTWYETDLCQFPYLQSLVLYYPNSDQMRQIQSDCLPNLVHLSVEDVPMLSLLPDFTQTIFSNGLPSLRHVRLGDTVTSYSWGWSQSPSLTSVSINCRDPTLAAFILVSSPNLRSLQVRLLFDAVPIFHSSPSPIDHPLKRFILRDPYHILVVNHVCTFLTWMPNVQQIYLNFLCKVSFPRFARSLINRLPSLTRFDCHIDDASSDQTTSVETIQLLHPCFARLRCPMTELNFRLFTTATTV